MKVKVMLAKPQTKNKPIKGGTRGGYSSSFRGDHRVGMEARFGIGGGMGVGGRMGMGLGMGMGMGIPRGMELIPYDGKILYLEIYININFFVLMQMVFLKSF